MLIRHYSQGKFYTIECPEGSAVVRRHDSDDHLMVPLNGQEVRIPAGPPELLPLLAETGNLGVTLMEEPEPEVRLDGVSCPGCGEADVARLQLSEGSETVRCDRCDREFAVTMATTTGSLTLAEPDGPDPNRPTPRPRGGASPMSDPEFDEKPGRRKPFAMRGQGKRLLLWTLAAVLGWCVLGLATPSRRPFICSVCRVERVDHRWLGLRWSDMEENECSGWYREHVERSHAHAWVKRGYCRRFGIPGLYGGYACVIGGPITGLSRRAQVDIYRHFDDPLEAKALFVRLGALDGEGSRMWAALMNWVNEGYPGTWHDWWEDHRDEAGDLDRGRTGTDDGDHPKG